MGIDKALLEMEEKTLLYRAVKFCQTFCDEILISSNNPEHEVDGLRLINDEIKDCGPMGGIYSSLKQSVNNWNFVLSVDAVFVEQEFIFELKKEIENFDAVIPFHKNGKEPLIAFYHRKITATMLQQIEKKNYRMTDLLELTNTRWINAEKWLDKNPRIFHNLNRSEDFEGVK